MKPKFRPPDSWSRSGNTQEVAFLWKTCLFDSLLMFSHLFIDYTLQTQCFQSFFGLLEEPQAFLKTYFSITVDIQHYISFRYSTQWLDMIRHLYNLWSDHPNKFSTYVTSYIVIILLTIFAILYFTSLWLFWSYQFVILFLKRFYLFIYF